VMVSVGQNVCTQGDVADRLWVLESGYMVAEYGATTTEVEAAPALIGETTILQDKFPKFENRPCGYCAATHCQLWELSRRDLQVVVRLYPHVGKLLYRGVAQHLLQRAGMVSHWGAVDTDGVQAFIAEIKQADHSVALEHSREELPEGEQERSSVPDAEAQPALVPPKETNTAEQSHGVRFSLAETQGVHATPPPSELAPSHVSEIHLEGVGEVETAAIIDLAMDYNEELRKELQPVQEASSCASPGPPAETDGGVTPESVKLMKEILSRIKTLESSINGLQRGGRAVVGSIGTVPRLPGLPRVPMGHSRRASPQMSPSARTREPSWHTSAPSFSDSL